jgi:hypothetical protein
MAVGESFEGKALGHVQSFRIGINGLDVGDVDGDGKNELVMIDDTTTYVYKWDGRGLIRFREIKGQWTPSYVWVSVADLDKNGKAEIYLSNPASQTMASEVLEWDGRDFKPILDKQPWFLRVVDIPGEGKRVLGQKRVPNGGYRRGVYVLKRQGDRFVSEKRLALPKFANVHNFALGDLSGGGGEPLTVLLTSYDYLTVFSGGAMQWKSDDYYGGALTYVEDKVDTTDRDVDTGAYHFLPSPIYLTDVDGDGKKEVMICQNYSRTRRLFSHLREFASGKLHFLDWDEVGLTEKYTTRKMTGPIVGYKVADLDNDGLDELVIASLTKEAIAVVQKPRSKLVVYDLK